MENKKVSILVPVYGVEKYIERCVRSLFEQTYENIEYIFVDDCTKDKSIEILNSVLAEYPDRKKQTKILHHDKNRGLSAARNTALDASTGDYLMHVDSDDYLREDAIFLLVARISQKSSQVLIFGYSIVKSDGVYPVPLQVEDKVSLINNYLSNRIPASMWNKFYDSEFYKATEVRSEEGINQGEDYVVVPRIIYKAERIDWLEDTLYYYEQSNVSSYSNNINETSINNMKRADDLLFGFFINVEDKDKFARSLKVLYARSALFLLKTGNRESWSKIGSVYDMYIRNSLALSVRDNFIVLCYKMKLCGLLESIFNLYKR